MIFVNIKYSQLDDNYMTMNYSNNLRAVATWLTRTAHGYKTWRSKRVKYRAYQGVVLCSLYGSPLFLNMRTKGSTARWAKIKLRQTQTKTVINMIIYFPLF